MNIKEIKEMLQLMNENGLTEIEIEKDGLKIKLKKGSGGFVEQTVIRQEARQQSSSAASNASADRETPKAASTAARNVIKSPMVGTYYSAPAPDAQPFIKQGGTVEVGQVICIIEAMKLMNEIKAEVKGKIVEILVNNGDPVEFGQPLFVLE